MRAEHLTVVVCWLRFDLDIENAFHDKLGGEYSQVTVSSDAALHSRTNLPLRASEPALNRHPYLFATPHSTLADRQQLEPIQACLIGHETNG